MNEIKNLTRDCGLPVIIPNVGDVLEI
jgi:hypothetical protein